MFDRLSPAPLVARRLWVYGGGLAGIILLRTQLPGSWTRTLLVSLVLGAMVLTYASELWLTADGQVARPELLVVGGIGIVAGIWLALRGTLPGVLFAGGGLLFLNRAMTTNDETV